MEEPLASAAAKACSVPDAPMPDPPPPPSGDWTIAVPEGESVTSEMVPVVLESVGGRAKSHRDLGE